MSPAALMNQRHSCVIAVRRVTRSTQSRLPAALPKHDANYPYGGFVDSLEDLGFCERGEAGDVVRERNTAPGGSLPMNTNGGGLSYMHSGMYGMYAMQESVRQMRGTAPAQIAGPKSRSRSALAACSAPPDASCSATSRHKVPCSSTDEETTWLVVSPDCWMT